MPITKSSCLERKVDFPSIQLLRDSYSTDSLKFCSITILIQVLLKSDNSFWVMRFFFYFNKPNLVPHDELSDALTWAMNRMLFVTVICHNDELCLTVISVGCSLNDLELFILFAENSQICLKISVIPILLTFIYLVAQNLLVNNQLNSLSNSIIIIVAHNCHI